jgi:hypothetical protein
MSAAFQQLLIANSSMLVSVTRFAPSTDIYIYSMHNQKYALKLTAVFSFDVRTRMEKKVSLHKKLLSEYQQQFVTTNTCQIGVYTVSC